MANRSRMQTPPADLFERAEWLDTHLPRALAQIPLHLGMQGVAGFEAQVFPQRVPTIGLDPACPQCGVETDEGTVEQEGERFRVSYGSCGHVFLVSPDELRARVGHAGA